MFEMASVSTINESPRIKNMKKLSPVFSNQVELLMLIDGKIKTFKLYDSVETSNTLKKLKTFKINLKKLIGYQDYLFEDHLSPEEWKETIPTAGSIMLEPIFKTIKGLDEEIDKILLLLVEDVFLRVDSFNKPLETVVLEESKYRGFFVYNMSPEGVNAPN